MNASPEYLVPTSIAEAAALLQPMSGDVAVLAGGQDLVPLMNQGRIAPRRIVDLKRLDDLRRVDTDPAFTVGALVTHREVERSPTIRAAVPLLAEAAGQIGGGVQVRNRGTIGGAVCAGNPAYDYLACLVVLEAEMMLVNPQGARAVAAEGFFQGADHTAKRPDELLTSVRIPPLPSGVGAAYRKLKYSDGCYCIVGAAAIVALESDRIISFIRVAVGGASTVPTRLYAAEDALLGRRMNDAALDEAADAAVAAITDPIDDALADGAYRSAMAGVMVRRAVAAAADRTDGRGTVA